MIQFSLPKPLAPATCRNDQIHVAVSVGSEGAGESGMAGLCKAVSAEQLIVFLPFSISRSFGKIPKSLCALHDTNLTTLHLGAASKGQYTFLVFRNKAGPLKPNLGCL